MPAAEVLGTIGVAMIGRSRNPKGRETSSEERAKPQRDTASCFPERLSAISLTRPNYRSYSRLTVESSDDSTLENGTGMDLSISARVRGAMRRDSQTGVYVSFCPTLRIYSQGTDENRARAALESAVKLFLSTCLRNGTLERVLRERGFSEVGESEDNRVPREAGEFIQVGRYDAPFEFEVPLYLFNEQEKRV